MRRSVTLAIGLMLVSASAPVLAIEPEILTPKAPAQVAAPGAKAVAPVPALAAETPPSKVAVTTDPVEGATPAAPSSPAVAVTETAAADAPVVPESALLTLIRQKLPQAPAAVPAKTAPAKAVPENADAQDRTALAAFYSGATGAPVWAGESGLNARGAAAISELRAANDWGLPSKSFDVGDLSKAAPADAEIKISLAVLKYARHARGGRIPEPAKQLSTYLDRTPQLLDPASVIEDASHADDPAVYLRSLHPVHPQFEKLRQRYLEAKAAGAAQAALAKTLQANMELWRWIPLDMGKLHVWVNLPEYKIRVMKDGAVLHEERVISGLTDKQTPVFSDEMETVVFQPYWGIPESIKIKDIYPSFARGGTVAKRYNLRVAQNGRLIDPSTVDWSTADIRKYDVYQPSGDGNMMGVLKFLFPNKHQTYMHDTPDKKLFDATDRAFSHGCMRVKNPVRLAEVVLEQDQGMDAAKVNELVQKGPENNPVPLTSKIPVHITYFTAWIGEDGKETLFKDMYGHEQRVKLALEGKFTQIARGPDHLAPVALNPLPYTQDKRSTGQLMQGFMNNF